MSTWACSGKGPFGGSRHRGQTQASESGNAGELTVSARSPSPPAHWRPLSAACCQTVKVRARVAPAAQGVAQSANAE